MVMPPIKSERKEIHPFHIKLYFLVVDFLVVVNIAENNWHIGGRTIRNRTSRMT